MRMATKAGEGTLASTTSTTQQLTLYPRRMATTSGIGSPVTVHVIHCGRGKVSPFRTALRSTSAIICWVPTFLTGKRPERIQRRIVSGLRQARWAASGTVIICIVVLRLTLAQDFQRYARSEGSPCSGSMPVRAERHGPRLRQQVNAQHPSAR